MIAFFIPTGVAKMEEALREAQANCSCDYLADVEFESGSFYAVFFARNWIIATGTPVRLVPYRATQQPAQPKVFTPSGTPLPAHLKARQGLK